MPAPKIQTIFRRPYQFEQCVNEDVTASAYASYPLLDAMDSVPLYRVPSPKRIKRIWKKVTTYICMCTSKKDFAKSIFELAPDMFEHYQVDVHIRIHILLVLY